jgi:hypothetical protein
MYDFLFIVVLITQLLSTNSMEQSSSWKPDTVVIQLVKKFPAIYGTHKFTTVFTRIRNVHSP